MLDKITLRQPDDWHLHLRDGNLLRSFLAHSSRVFRRAIIMPNLSPPITTIDLGNSYRDRILKSIPRGISFTPLMTAYLTDDMSPETLIKGYEQKLFIGAKLYPANSTTNSSEGVSDLNNIDLLFETMERLGMPLLIHGEEVDQEVDIFDREAVFIERRLSPLLKKYPKLRVVLEHITTKDAVDFVQTSGYEIAATITPHHLHINRNALFAGGLNSDFYCLPVVKREIHRLALRKAATSGKPCFFLGTDSAPHLRPAKENSCACAGIFNSPFALESYAEVFDSENKMENLEPFCSEFGAKFYGLKLNSKKITLVRKIQMVPKFINVGEFNQKEKIIPFHAGEKLSWTLLTNEEGGCAFGSNS